MVMWIEESFTGSDGAVVTVVNTPSLARITPGFEPTFTAADAYGGSGVGVSIVTTAELGMPEFDHVESADTWHVCYFKPRAFPGSNSAVLAVWGNSGNNPACDVRLRAEGTLQLRNSSFAAQDESASITLNEYVRLALRVQSNGTGGNTITLHIYKGANVDGDTPDETLTATSSSGAATSVNNFRWGATAALTIDTAFDEFHLGDEEWKPGSGAPPSEAHYNLTALWQADTSGPDVATWQVDATGSVGTVTLVQTSGTTATPVESPTGVFTVTAPAGTDDLVYTLAADSDGTPATATVTLSRGEPATSGRSYMWVFLGGDPADLANWSQSPLITT